MIDEEDSEADTEDAGDDREHRDNEFRLIEQYFPSEVVSERSRKERYQRGQTPHTVFTWWARRPFAAASALVSTSLLETDRVDEQTTDLIDEYARRSDPGLLRVALDSRLNDEDQRVLDLFGGGGTIPLEAARLGARVETLENNELAHFIQHLLLERSQGQDGLARRVRRAGQRLLEDLEAQTDAFFPARDAGERGRTIAYLWTRELRCPDCEAWLSLTRRPWVSKQRGRRWFIDRRPDPERRVYTAELREGGAPTGEQSAWEGRTVECPFCDHRVDRDRLGELMRNRSRDRMTTVCTSEGRAARSRKQFAEARPEVHECDRHDLIVAMVRDLREIGEQLPDASLPRWSGVTNPSLYGMARHTELFNLRQRAVLVRTCRLLRDHHRRWTDEMGAESGAVVAGMLSGLVDQLVDWNSRLSTWISENEQVGRALSGPGMPMVWDYVEIDPLEEAPANLWDKLERIVSGIRAIPEFDHTPVARRGDARNLPWDDDTFEVVATDPPYFDNIFYSVLADTIYVWKRLALGEIFPECFESPTTDRSRELTMNPHVHGDDEEAARHYTEGMTRVLAEARRVVVDDGIVALIFAHGTVSGWTAIVEALAGADLELVAAWPMYVERADRPRGMSARAVNTSFVLVARHRNSGSGKRRWSKFAADLEDRLRARDEQLNDESDYGADTRGRTLFGLGVSMLSRAGRLVDEEGEEIEIGDGVERVAEIVEAIVGREVVV